MKERNNVYPPSEDTVLLASAARRTGAAAEVGCGSGAATTLLAEKASYLVAIDVSPQAALETRLRASKTGASNIDVLVADMLKPLRPRSLNTVYSNPPYLPCSYEEEPLWCGGPSGVEFSLRLAREAWRTLKPHGCLLLIASTLSDTHRLLEELSRLYATTRITAEEPVGLYEKLLLIEACSPLTEAQKPFK